MAVTIQYSHMAAAIQYSQKSVSNTVQPKERQSYRTAKRASVIQYSRKSVSHTVQPKERQSYSTAERAAVIQYSRKSGSHTVQPKEPAYGGSNTVHAQPQPHTDIQWSYSHATAPAPAAHLQAIPHSDLQPWGFSNTKVAFGQACDHGVQLNRTDLPGTGGRGMQGGEGVSQGSVREGTSQVSVRSQSGLTQGSLRDHSGITQGSIRDHSGITLMLSHDYCS